MRIILTIALCLALSCPVLAGEIVWIDGCQWIVVSKDKDAFAVCDKHYKALKNTDGIREVLEETGFFRFCEKTRDVSVWFAATHSGNCTILFDPYNEPRFESFWARPTGNCKPYGGGGRDEN